MIWVITKFKVKDVYVREAYRLLQRSIIFVETQDIDLDDNEEVRCIFFSKCFLLFIDV